MTHTHLLSLTKINPLKPVLVAHWNLTLLQIPWFTYPPSIQFQIGTFQLYRQEVLKYKYLRNPIVISLITMRHNFIHRLHCCKKWLGPPRCGPTVTMKPVNQLGWCSFQIHLSQCTENTFVILARKHNTLAQWERRACIIKVLPWLSHRSTFRHMALIWVYMEVNTFFCLHSNNISCSVPVFVVPWLSNHAVLGKYYSYISFVSMTKSVRMRNSCKNRVVQLQEMSLHKMNDINEALGFYIPDKTCFEQTIALQLYLKGVN